MAIHLGTAAHRNLSDAATLRRFRTADGGYQLLNGADAPAAARLPNALRQLRDGQFLDMVRLSCYFKQEVAKREVAQGTVKRRHWVAEELAQRRGSPLKKLGETTVSQPASQSVSQSVSQWIIQPCSQFIRSILLSFILSGFHVSHFMWFSPLPFSNFSFPSLFVISFHFLWFHVLVAFGFTQPFIPSCPVASLFYSFRNFRPTGK